MKTIFFILLFMLSSCSFGQNEWWKIKRDKQETKAISTTKDTNINSTDTIQQQAPNLMEDTLSNIPLKPGKIEYIQDPTIDKLIEFKADKMPPYNKAVMNGFRIQLYFDHDKNKVEEARIKLLKSNMDAVTYVQYKTPNYLLLYGDFRTQLNAEKARAEILSDFPEAIIIKDKIVLPNIEIPVSDSTTISE